MGAALKGDASIDSHAGRQAIGQWFSDEWTKYTHFFEKGQQIPFFGVAPQGECGVIRKKYVTKLSAPSVFAGHTRLGCTFSNKAGPLKMLDIGA